MVDLSPRAFLALSIARKLGHEEQELVAGVLRAEARETRRLTEIREGLDIVSRAEAILRASGAA